MQKLFDSNIANSQTISGLEGQLAHNAAGALVKPLDLSPGAITDNLVNLGNRELQPQLKQAQTALDQQLANQGLTPGSAGWGYQQGQFGLNKAQAENDLILQGQNTAMQQLEAQYNSPLNALTALRSGSQVSQPGIGNLAPSTQSPIAAPNYQGAVYQGYQGQMQAYQSQMQQQNAMMSGLFGLGGDILKGGIPLLSDRRDKKDIEPLGDDPQTGLEVSAYRYKTDADSSPKTVGIMAQDLEKKYPGSTREISGHMIIKPEAVARFGLGR